MALETGSGEASGSSPDTLSRRVWADARRAAADNDYARALGYGWGKILAALLVLAGAVIWNQGGFERAPDAPVRSAAAPIGPGQPIDGGLYLVVPETAWVSYAPMNSSDDSAQALAGTSYLMVAMRVTLQGKTPNAYQGLDDALVWLRRKEPHAAPDPIAPEEVLRDGNAVPLVLQPGLPTRVIARWAVRESDFTPPTNLWLGLKGFQLRENNALDLGPSWSDTGPKGSWNLPLRDRRELPTTEQKMR